MISTVFSRHVAHRAVCIVLCAVIGMALALALGLSACGHATDGNTSAPSQQQATAEDQLQEQHQAQSKEQGQAQSREQNQSQNHGQDTAAGKEDSSSEEKALQALDISKVSAVKEQTDEGTHRLSYTLAFDVTNNGNEKVSFAPSMTADLNAKDAYGDSVKADSRMSLPMTQTYDDLQASDVVFTDGNDSFGWPDNSTIGFISYLEPGATRHCQATVTPETSLDGTTSFDGKTINPTEATASNFEIRVCFLDEATGTSLIYNPYDETITEDNYARHCRFYYCRTGK